MARLGKGGDGPWEDRTQLVLEHGENPALVRAGLNRTLSVQVFEYADYPGWTVLTIRRHDGGNQHPGWRAMQAIKNHWCGLERWGYEAFPPEVELVDNHNLWHIWVGPPDWRPPIGMGPFYDGVRI